MHSFIILSPNPDTRNDYARKFCLDRSVSPFDITWIGHEEETKEKKASHTIGINVIKKIKQTIFLHPLNGQIKAVVITEAHTLTHEAQNALLKLLEEPPPQTFMILLSESKENLLETIQSRCSVIEITDKPIFTEIALPSSVAGALSLAESHCKQREEALAFLNNLLFSLRQKLIQTHSGETIAFIRDANQTRLTIQKTNTNIRLALEVLLLKNLP